MKRTFTKANVMKDLDYWTLSALNDAIRYAEKNYCREMIAERMGQATGMMQVAASLGLIDSEQFDHINWSLASSSLNREGHY